MAFHKILERQLARLKLSEEALPTNKEAWQEFLSRINNRYVDADQERYLLERSMDLSSRELSELNQKLANAQRIARLGYWIYDKENDTITWSSEVYELFGFDSAVTPPNFEEVMQLIYEPDQIELRRLIKESFVEGKGYEYEFQLQTRDKEKRWAYVKGQPQNNGDRVILSGITIDITSRKLAEQEVAELHQQVLVTARRAGMADVATAILHNVGNILNSANVSLSLLQENSERGHYKKLFSVITMLKENLSSVATYLTEDPKGKLIPEYLVKAGELLEGEYGSSVKEIGNLNKQLQHIKDIVAMQKSMSGVSGVAETIFLPEIIETALKMSGSSSFEDKKIKIHKNYEQTPFISIDSSKLLQILVNLIQNAKDAVLSNAELSEEKQISLSIQETPPNFITIQLKDNGIGIDPANITNIFSFGFTTKKNGHGFGLHSSALAAKELGGNLTAESTGPNQGATFILTLPLHAHKKAGDAHEFSN
jgi:PAS domain S-box-containing protein